MQAVGGTVELSRFIFSYCSESTITIYAIEQRRYNKLYGGYR